ncbi:uncharacterized protein LY79DRAFT_208351 [Colletotrichum navitas]|uniref:Uncharacterized protein n=1 Tax=Colletotrichum navitas TaxID=681940 RepID=A0AAD8VAH0_9PEZI|nr:uncharacterized protein LY79DRAFT_208351 [Colletotrichum navitas]KAK1599104.1 hypothetical protein LY79DRAFT_208351 [Colletotrichum navitas]
MSTPHPPKRFVLRRSQVSTMNDACFHVWPGLVCQWRYVCVLKRELVYDVHKIASINLAMYHEPGIAKAYLKLQIDKCQIPSLALHLPLTTNQCFEGTWSIYEKQRRDCWSGACWHRWVVSQGVGATGIILHYVGNLYKSLGCMANATAIVNESDGSC